jgi:hypothetical protein
MPWIDEWGEVHNPVDMGDSAPHEPRPYLRVLPAPRVQPGRGARNDAGVRSRTPDEPPVPAQAPAVPKLPPVTEARAMMLFHKLARAAAVRLGAGERLSGLERTALEAELAMHSPKAARAMADELLADPSLTPGERTFVDRAGGEP